MSSQSGQLTQLKIIKHELKIIEQIFENYLKSNTHSGFRQVFDTIDNTLKTNCIKNAKGQLKIAINKIACKSKQFPEQPINNSNVAIKCQEEPVRYQQEFQRDIEILLECKEALSQCQKKIREEIEANKKLCEKKWFASPRKTEEALQSAENRIIQAVVRARDLRKNNSGRIGLCI